MKRQKGEILIATAVVIILGIFGVLVTNPGGSKVADSEQQKVAEAQK
jgi:uncharacterized membrane protein